MNSLEPQTSQSSFPTKTSVVVSNILSMTIAECHALGLLNEKDHNGRYPTVFPRRFHFMYASEYIAFVNMEQASSLELFARVNIFSVNEMTGEEASSGVGAFRPVIACEFMTSPVLGADDLEPLIQNFAIRPEYLDELSRSDLCGLRDDHAAA